MAISALSGTWTIGESGWPWPQVFFTENRILAVAVDNSDLSLYKLVNTANTWTATKIARLGYLARIDAVDIVAFGKFIVITVVGTYNSAPWKAIYQILPDSDSMELFPDVPAGNSCCNFKNQLIIGGLSSGQAPWESLGECSVAWGGISNSEMSPENDQNAGFVKMPWNSHGDGKVYKVRRLGETLRVYGNRGIATMIPYIHERAAGFGMDPTIFTGILSESAMAGDHIIHGYLDANYDFWIATEKETRKLGYRPFMKLLTNGRIQVSYEAQNHRFYVSDGTITYAVVAEGMYSTHQVISSVGIFNGFLCGFTKLGSDTKIRLTTTPTNMGYSAMKSIEVTETGAEYLTAADAHLKMAISTRYSYKKSYLNTGYIVLNERGIMTKRVTGRDFKIHLEGTYDSAGTFRLEFLKAAVQFSDKRSIRGRINVA